MTRFLMLLVTLLMVGCATPPKPEENLHAVEIRTNVLVPCPGKEVRPDFDDKVIPALAGTFAMLDDYDKYLRALDEVKAARGGILQRDQYIDELEKALALCRKVE